MATVEDVARSAMSRSNAGENWLLASMWVNERYRQLVRKVRYFPLRKTGMLALPAMISAGTITVVRGSATVVGDVTAIAAWGAAIEGRFLRVASGWYRILDYDLVTFEITLDAAYGEDDGAAVEYEIVARNHVLPSSVRYLGSVLHPRMRRQLEIVPQEFLDSEYPDRPMVSGLLDFVAEVGGSVRTIEVYPVPDELETIQYTYWEEPAELTLTSTLPAFIDVDILSCGVLADCYQYKAALAADAGKQEAATLYANWSGREETVWQQRIREAIKMSKGVDDATVYVKRMGTTRRNVSDVTNAKEQILTQW